MQNKVEREWGVFFGKLVLNGASFDTKIGCIQFLYRRELIKINFCYAQSPLANVFPNILPSILGGLDNAARVVCRALLASFWQFSVKKIFLKLNHCEKKYFDRSMTFLLSFQEIMTDRSTNGHTVTLPITCLSIKIDWLILEIFYWFVKIKIYGNR